MTRAQLEWRLIYTLVVAGKSARFANDAVARLFAAVPEAFRRCPISWIGLTAKEHVLRIARTGNYVKLERALRLLAESGLDLAIVTPGELERIPGIGPKTSRFFVTWTRPWERYAVIDRHVLTWLRSRGHQVPSTPPGELRSYTALEALFIEEAEAAGETVRDLDLRVWRAAATADNVVPEVG
jgi:hypothetical protein